MGLGPATINAPIACRLVSAVATTRLLMFEVHVLALIELGLANPHHTVPMLSEQATLQWFG